MGRIVVIDNGTQYGDLYAKNFRDLGIAVDTFSAGIYHEDGKMVKPRISLDDVAGYAGIVVAGGKSSVTVPEPERVNIDPRIYSSFEGPVLGTCFGHQDMADRLGGIVVSGLKQCGPVYTTIDNKNPFFSGLDETQRVNATHNDGVLRLPDGFEVIACSTNELDFHMHIDAMYREPANGNDHRIGTQFHPETFLTENGRQMLSNFARMCGLKTEIPDCRNITPNIGQIVKEQYELLTSTIGNLKVFLPISGGIDSTVATAMLLNAGIDPKQIVAFHIDTGFNRYNESREVVARYHKMGWDFVEMIDAGQAFADFSLPEENLRSDLKEKHFGGIKLKDAVFSEHKRYLLQAAYAKTIDNVIKRNSLDVHNSILVQGTNQADKVESARGGSKARGSAHIKSHHNVGNFTERYRQAGHLLEPMDRFFKSDIYELGKRFSLPEFFGTRKPYPGPGLLVRLGGNDMVKLGKYTGGQVAALEKRANKYASRHNSRVMVTNIEAVGNCGDERAEGLISVIMPIKGNPESELKNLQYVAGQLPHYTTFDRMNCLTRFIVPLFPATNVGRLSKFANSGETVEALQLFDYRVDKVVDELGLKMTQLVNYAIAENLGHDGKITMVFRPWLAPNLMTGMPVIPDDPNEMVHKLGELKDCHKLCGNICIDLTYKPIGGTEIN